MSWQLILKDEFTVPQGNNIPAKNNLDVEWMTLLEHGGDEGYNTVVNTVKRAIESKKTRGIVNAREWANKLANMSEDEFKAKHPSKVENMKSILERGKKLSDELNEMIKHNEPGATTNTAENMDKVLEALEEGNTQPLLEFIGDVKTTRGRGGQHRKNKNKLLDTPETKEFILSKIQDDVDFWYVDTSEVSFTVNNVKVEDKTTTALERYNVDIDEDENGLVIKLPDKMSPSDFKDLKDTIFNLEDRSTKFVMVGKVLKSPLYSLYGDEKTSSRVSQELRDMEDTTYISTVDSSEDVLSYLKLLTRRGKGWRNAEFMPEVNRGSKKGAMMSILDSTSRPIVRPALSALLSTEEFDLNALMASGAAQREKKLMPEKARPYLQPRGVDNEPLQPTVSADLTISRMTNLRERFETLEYRMPPFMRWIEGLDETDEDRMAFEKLLEVIPDVTLSLFPADEAKALFDLRQEEDGNVTVNREGLTDIYPTTQLQRLGSYLKPIFEVSPTLKDMFERVNPHFYKLNSRLKIRPATLRNFIEAAKTAREVYDEGSAEDYTEEGDSETVSQFKRIIADIEEEGWNDIYQPNHVTPQDLLQMLVQIDYSYGTAALNKLKNRYLDAEEDKELRARKLRRLILGAERLFPEIKQSLVDKVKAQVDAIINDPEKYYEYLEIKGTNKIYLLFNRLIEEDLIKEENE